MAMDRGTFETLCPSRFLAFSFPNPLQLGHDFLRIAVLDSPRPADSDPRVAALLVPEGREHDWLFSSSCGHLQLLLATSPPLSRLVLVGNPPQPDRTNATYTRQICSDDSSRARFDKMLLPLLLALSPKSAFQTGIPEMPFLVYEDNVFRSVSVELCNGSVVGEMLVEDVEIEMAEHGEESASHRELRRRLRFKRMPNLIQSQVRIVPAYKEFRPDTRVLVQPYLQPMVASLSLIAPYLEERSRVCLRRLRALCVGVGGGALLSFLRAHLGFFDILGVEMDETVLQVAIRHFGLVEDEFLRIFVGDGIELIRNLGRGAVSWNSVYGKVEFGSVENLGVTCSAETVRLEHGFGVNEMEQSPDLDSLVDVIMVDLDSSDVTNAQRAPPLEFVQKSVLLAVRSVLHERGVFVLNVIVSRGESFYVSLVTALREVFSELYEIDTGNGENYVLVATVSPVVYVALESKSCIVEKLKEIINGVHIERLRKI